MTDEKKIQEVTDTLDNLPVFALRFRCHEAIAFAIKAENVEGAINLGFEFADLHRPIDWVCESSSEIPYQEAIDDGLSVITAQDLERIQEEKKKKLKEVVDKLDNKKPFLVEHAYSNVTKDCYLCYARDEHEAYDMARNANPNFINVCSTRTIDLKKITILEE